MACFAMDLGVSSRQEKSLGLLTTKFVSLLQEAQDGVLDLKVAADTLAVRQKRRIYDITNVLEGIGLIEKKSKNSIQWKGAGPGCNTQEVSDRLENLKSDIAILTKREHDLDLHRSWIQQSIRNITEDSSNKAVAYINHKDICQCFEGDTLLGVQAPNGTNLEVPSPDMIDGKPGKYQIHLKSNSGSIFVVLVNMDKDSGQPTVVVVPPTSAPAPETASTSGVVSSVIAPAVAASTSATESTPPVTSQAPPTQTPTPVVVAAADVAMETEAAAPVPVENIAEPMVVVEEPLPPPVVEAKTIKKEPAETKTIKKEATSSPAPVAFTPTRPATRALANKLQQEKLLKEKQRAPEPKVTRTFTKTVTRSVAAAAQEATPMEVSPVSSLAQRRQSPRKAVQQKVAARLLAQEKKTPTSASVTPVETTKSSRVAAAASSAASTVTTAPAAAAAAIATPAPAAVVTTTPTSAVATPPVTISNPPNAASTNKLNPVDVLKDMASEMFFDSNRADYFEELISSEMFAPLLRLSPPPSDRDYYFNMEDTEGLCDLFDVPLLSM